MKKTIDVSDRSNSDYVKMIKNKHNSTLAMIIGIPTAISIVIILPILVRLFT